MDCYCMRPVPNVPRSSEEVVQGAGRGRPTQERREVPTSVASCILDRHGSCRTHSDGLSLDFSLQSPMRCSLEDVLCTAEQSSFGQGLFNHCCPLGFLVGEEKKSYLRHYKRCESGSGFAKTEVKRGRGSLSDLGLGGGTCSRASALGLQTAR